MFLKTLVIRGFKSFADRATFDFEPGITVVVGPNGSGKSNVVDAIAWVLGAQAPTAVRSQRMDDVIFAGTSKRAALGRAEVSLTIDNSSGYLSVGFNEVTISRTLFRSGDSEYAINGVACRLLDVQELLSDAGVGRQQHVIANQGQLDAILNARPEERRAIIEEAAGVLKHRRRRERSERRLAASEANLTRVNDLLREVRRQLRPLERQAQAAVRAEEIQLEARQLRLYLGGRHLAGLEARTEAARARQGALAARSAEAEGALVELDGEVGRLENDLRRAGTGALGEVIARAETVRERARGLAAVLAERGRALERELAHADDRSALAVLDTELERAHQEDRAAAGEVARLEEERAALEAEDHALDSERVAAGATELPVPGGVRPRGPDADESPPPDVSLAEVRRELAGIRATLEQREAELRRLAERRRHQEDRLGRLRAEAGRLGGNGAPSVEAGDQLARVVTAAEQARQEADERLAVAEASRREADATQRAWEARAQALGEALHQVREQAGAEHLAGRDGVLGTLLDVVEVDPGWEAAVEAAAGESLRAVVVDGGRHARTALEALSRAGRAGAVLPADARAAGMASAVDVPLGEPVMAHVRPRRSLPAAQQLAVRRLLDRLVGHAVRVDGAWEAVLDSAVAHGGSHPHLVLVSVEGDRFGPTGWHLGAARARATDALHEEARRRAEAAAAARLDAVADHDRARAGAEQASRAYQQAVRAADEHAVRHRSAEVATERCIRELAEADDELADLDAQVRQLEAARQLDGLRQQRLAADLPVLEARVAEVAARVRREAERAADLGRRAGELTRRRGLLDTRASMLDERRRTLEGRRVALRRSLEDAVAAGREQESRKIELVARSAVVGRLTGVVSSRLATVEGRLTWLRDRRDERASEVRELSRQVDDARRRRTDVERRLVELAEQARRMELEATEAAVRLETARDALRRDLDAEPEAALAGVGEPPPLPEGMDPEARLRDLERELRLLGPVNPLARQEHDALSERHTFLEAQLADVRASRRELARVIRAIDDEISSTFAAAFGDVGGHFTQLFETLFPGGRGELRLTTPDDLLGTGVDVEARPSGKNVRKLSLLSGGERALTALGLLFAIFRSRPSPFYVLDEVEAALDDVNLRRFLDLLEEFRSEAQLIVVSHQKRTMEIADCLYGVTMKPGESSTVLSERLRSAG